MKPDEKTMTETVEELREAGAQWNEVAKAIGSSSGAAAMKRFQRAKKIGPYSKPRSRKPKKPLVVISENNDPNAAIKKMLLGGLQQVEAEAARLRAALKALEAS